MCLALLDFLFFWGGANDKDFFFVLFCVFVPGINGQKGKKKSFKPLSVNSGFSHFNWRQGGSVNFIAAPLNGLPTPQLGWFGGFFIFFLSLFLEVWKTVHA